MSATTPTRDDLNLTEQMARIDQLLADRDQKLQAMKFFPWQVAVGLLAAGATLFAAGAAFIKLIG